MLLKDRTIDLATLFNYILSIRPLHHPDPEGITVAGVLHALSDPVRVAIVRELARGKRGLNCCAIVARAKVDLPKSTLSQHFQILRETGLVFSERKGTELANQLRKKELEKRFPGLLRSILKSYERE